MTNPLLEKYAELHRPKQPEPSKPVYNHLRPEEHRLVQILEGMIQDIRNGKVFYDSYQEEKENYAMKTHLDFSYNPYAPITPNNISTGRMINIRVFKKYE